MVMYKLKFGFDVDDAGSDSTTNSEDDESADGALAEGAQSTLGELLGITFTADDELVHTVGSRAAPNRRTRRACSTASPRRRWTCSLAAAAGLAATRQYMHEYRRRAVRSGCRHWMALLCSLPVLSHACQATTTRRWQGAGWTSHPAACGSAGLSTCWRRSSTSANPASTCNEAH